jgi:hypothetical protein
MARGAKAAIGEEIIDCLPEVCPSLMPSCTAG